MATKTKVKKPLAEKAKEDNSDEALLEIAKERFRLAEQAEQNNRNEALDDLKFRAGIQWPEEIKSARQQENRPCLTINRLPQFVRQVTNDLRQNRPSIKVNPVDDKADIETAEVFQGIIRHIEYASNADYAYDTAGDSAVTKGLGYFRVITDYCDPYSFQQEIKIKRILNSFSVFFDPNSTEPDGSDANWAFVVEDMAKEDFEAQFPDAEASKMEGWEALGNSAPGWATDKSCRVAEYFFKTFKKTTLVQLNDGGVLEKSKLPDSLPDGVSVVDERETILPAIKWVKMNGLEVLDKTDWLGQWIPIIPVIGDEMDIDGERIFEGIVRHAKDPQRMYNYWASNETEMIALAPKAPFIAVEGSFEGHEAKWATANSKNHAYMEYKGKSIGGQPAGPPTRQVYEPPVQAINQARMNSSEDLKATTGIYDASLGNRSNENSGVAIQRRNNQAQTNNFHYADNLSRSIRHLGRILIDLIPKVYNGEQAIRTIGEDGEQDIVTINRVFDPNTKDNPFNLSAGKYDVTVSTGPSYQTKRQEASAAMLEMSGKVPQLMQVAPDLVFKALDFPMAQELAERMKKTVPPQFLDDDKNKQPLPPQVSQQLQQQGQMIDQLTQHVNELTKILDTKQMEIESKERIETMKVKANLEIALAQIGSSDAQALLEHEVGAIQHRQKLLHDASTFDQEMELARQQAAVDAKNQQPTGGQSPGQPMGEQ